jgi:cholesterol transport system auxiliary component
VCVGALSGCTGLFHSTAQPEQTYYLRAAPAPAAAATAMTASLRLAHPGADPGFDSSHIMLVQADHRLDFYAASRWAGPVPDVIEALAVETLRTSGAWASVQDSTSPFPADYLLQVTVRRFEADYTAAALPEVHVLFDCIIGRRDGREVVATFSASGTAAASENRLSAVVAAFQQASAAALVSLAQQAAQAVAADTQNGASPTPSSPRHTQ